MSRRLGIYLKYHPAADGIRILGFRWKERDGSEHVVETAILTDWNPPAAARLFRQLADTIEEKHISVLRELRANKQMEDL